MTNLPIRLRVVERTGDTTVMSTEAGHRFRLPDALAAETEFELDPSRLKEDAIDGLRPAMCRALLNEIIGAPAPAMTTDAEKNDETS